MVIEALIHGEVFSSYPVPEAHLQPIDGASWQENVRGREMVIAMELEAYRQKMERFLHKGIQIEYRLVFPSKMNAHETD